MSNALARGDAVTFGVLGPVAAWGGDGAVLGLRGPKHRAVLARLLVARGRVVPVTRLVDDLWTDPPPAALGAVRTFVAALRRILEPQRPPRAPAQLLVTDGPGYGLRPEPEAVDAWRFEGAIAAAAQATPGETEELLGEALGWWRGPSYAEFADEDWAQAERARLAELRSSAVERLAEARLALGRAEDAIPDLDAHVAAHPWRERAWALLSLALYRAGRQGDALVVLRRARATLAEQLGWIRVRTCAGWKPTSFVKPATSGSTPEQRTGYGPAPPPPMRTQRARVGGRGWSRLSGCSGPWL